MLLRRNDLREISSAMAEWRSLECQQSTSYYKHIEMQKEIQWQQQNINTWPSLKEKEGNLQVPEEGYQSGNDSELDIS